MAPSPDDLDYASEFVFNWAIFAIFAWLVPHVSIAIGYYRDAVIRSEEWKQKGLEQEALLAVRNWAFWAILLALFLISMLGVAIGLTTQDLDDRMYAVLQGASRLIGAVYLFLISVFMPRWCDVYLFKRWMHAGDIKAGSNLKVLRFNVFWEILRLFGRNCVFLLPFFCGVPPAGIPASIVAGVVLGFFLDFCVYKFRRMKTELRKQRVAFSTGMIIAILASLLFSDGCWFIASVWGKESVDNRYILVLCCFFGAFIFAIIVHGLLWRQAKALRGSEEDPSVSKLGSSGSRPHTHMAMSLMVAKLSKNSKAAEEGDEANEKLEQVKEEGSEDIEVSGDIKANAMATSTLVVSEETLDPSTDDTDALALATEKNAAPEENLDPSTDDTDALALATEKDAASDDNLDPSTDYTGEEDEEKEPSNCALLKTKVSCCGCVRGSDKTRKQKGVSCCGWFGWTALAIFSLVIVMVNVGATVQGEGVKENLPLVGKILYDNIDAGPVCAYDGGLEGIDANITEFSNITTFSDMDAAHAAGFLVLHCGACSACSDWYNIRLEYTTRNYLASAGAKCGRKSIFGGRSAVQKCIEAPPIEFRGKCAECWTTDILCTKGNCTWIYLQSTMIDAVGDFAVGPDTVTAASCEEAFCEVGQFVPCSGATRRRMNVTSSIDRPGAQSCGIVDVDWAELYPGE